MYQLNPLEFLCTQHSFVFSALVSHVKPVLNWANICFAEHSLGYSSNYTLFLN